MTQYNQSSWKVVPPIAFLSPKFASTIQGPLSRGPPPPPIFLKLLRTGKKKCLVPPPNIEPLMVPLQSQSCSAARGGVLGSGFAGYVPLASQNPHPIIVYSVANYRPHLSHFWANVIVISRTEFNASRLLNIKTTAGTIFQPWIFLFLNLCLPEFSYPKNPENLRPHSCNSTKNLTPL